MLSLLSWRTWLMSHEAAGSSLFLFIVTPLSGASSLQENWCVRRSSFLKENGALKETLVLQEHHNDLANHCPSSLSSTPCKCLQNDFTIAYGSICSQFPAHRFSSWESQRFPIFLRLFSQTVFSVFSNGLLIFVHLRLLNRLCCKLQLGGYKSFMKLSL